MAKSHYRCPAVIAEAALTMPKLHHLRDFVAIAHARSVRGAARSLGLSQPALTRSLSELEQELRVDLVERHARGVQLTPAGERFLVRASAALEELRRGLEEAGQAQGDMQGAVTVALSSAAALALLPTAYPEFRRQCPDVSLRLLDGLFPAVEPRLRDGQLDFYVGPRPERSIGSGYRVESLFDNERVVLGRVGHPLDGARSMRELQGAEWVVTGLRERVEEEFEEQFAALGLPSPQVTTRAESMMALLVLLSTTDALAFLPVQWASSALFQGRVKPIAVREPLTAPDIVLVRRARLPLTPAAQRFSDLLQRAVPPSLARPRSAARAGNIKTETPTCP